MTEEGDHGRLITQLALEHEGVGENVLRPSVFGEFVGQQKVVANLRVFIQAAVSRGESVDHILLSGLPGLGKTTLAHLVARELGKSIVCSSGPALVKAGDIVGILSQLQEGDVLFIDEIHRLPQVVEEHLYSAMEDFVLDIVLDSGPSARNVRIPLNRFTLIGATTQEGRLSRPFRDRFQIHEKLELYPPSDLELMIDRSARILHLSIEPRARAEVSRRSRGTPRIVNRLLRRLRDFAQVGMDSALTLDVCRSGLEKLGIDDRGLDATDRRILKVIAMSGGQPVGLKTIAASVGEDEETLQEVYEPYLLQEQFILKTPRGRVLGRSSEGLDGLPAPGHPLAFPEP